MADLKRLDEKKDADRLTAQLGLATSDNAEVEGECLTPEQMADVATNYCSPEERQAALAHFATCRTCYNAWVGVSLSLVAMESGLERRKRPLLSMRNLGYLGSAMAVAASVVVFFNIQGDMDQVMPVAEKAIERQESPPPAKVNLQFQQAEQRSAEPEKKIEKEAGRAKRAEQQAPAAPSSSLLGRSRLEERAAAEELEVADAVVEADADAAALWLGEIATYCQEKRYVRAPETWQSLLERGHDIIASSPAKDRPFLQRIVGLMDVEGSQSLIGTRCEEIAPLVAGVGQKE